ncbi:MAG: alpha-amylase family glycosyl hydrolase, partial [Promethearchaeota archaeon]
MSPNFSTHGEVISPSNFTFSQASLQASLQSAVDVNKSEIIPIGEGIMLQPYYWKVPDDGKWWATLKGYLPEFADFGIDSLWLPPAQKTPPGDTTTYGYEPFDYYDLGEFNQKGRIRSRYGTRTELESLIQSANNLNIGAVADIVINHNQGGELEYNPYFDIYAYTDFSSVASGRFPRNYSHYYPSIIYGPNDNLAWGDLPDLIHAHPYVHDQLLEYG